MDYLPIGYNFNNIHPLFIIPIKQNNIILINTIKSKQYLNQFYLSLRDFSKSIFITIKYTNLRKQFKTIPNQKIQRSIITYQAVSSRIIDAIAWLIGFSTLCSKVYALPEYIPLISPLLQYCHNPILHQLIALRECCGGFGYLQASGHPSGLQRVSYRAATINPIDLPESSILLKRFHFYSSQQSIQQFFGKNLTTDMLTEYTGIFVIFITVCINMKKNRQKLSQHIYQYQFMKQSAIQGMHSSQAFSRIKDSYLSVFLGYLVCSYILQYSRYINWKYIKIQRQELLKIIIQIKNNYLNKITPQLPFLSELIGFKSIRNVIIANNNNNEEQFYQKVMKISKQSYRNSNEFKNQVRRPIIQLLVQNRARL